MASFKEMNDIIIEEQYKRKEGKDKSGLVKSFFDRQTKNYTKRIQQKGNSQCTCKVYNPPMKNEYIRHSIKKKKIKKKKKKKKTYNL